MIQVLLVEDSPMVQAGFSAFVNRIDGVKLLDVASTGAEGVQLANKLKPDVIVMDLKLPGMEGLEAIKIIKDEDPEAKIIVFTGKDDDKSIHDALQAGATSFMRKDATYDQYKQYIEATAQGIAMIYRSYTPVSPKEDNPLNFTQREREVLCCICDGNINRKIAQRLECKVGTVKIHVHNILKKTGAANRTQLISIAMKHGYCNQDKFDK